MKNFRLTNAGRVIALILSLIAVVTFSAGTSLAQIVNREKQDDANEKDDVIGIRTTVAKSPNHHFLVRSTVTGEDADQNYVHKIEIVHKMTGQVVASWSNIHRSTDAEWSKDSHFVYVNDKPANSGDYLYVVRVEEKPVSGQIIRRPHEDVLRRLLASYCKSNQQLGKVTLCGEAIVGKVLRSAVTFIVEKRHTESYVKTYRKEFITPLDTLQPDFPIAKDLAASPGKTTQ